MPETFPSQLASLFGAVQAQVATVRAALGYPALNGPDGAGTGTIAVGAEYAPYQLAAPSITVVPTGESFQPAQKAGSYAVGQIPPKQLYSSWLHFTAFIWGDPDPNFGVTQDVLYDFDACLELRREFIEALVNPGGIPTIHLDGATWDQPNNERRSGRMYVLRFSVLSRINNEPYIYIPYATATTSGVSVATTFYAISGDGTSTQVEAAYIAPPP